MVITNNILEGKTILITRPVYQGQSLAKKIQALRGHALIFPTIAIIPPTQNELKELEEIVRELDQYQIAIFTSINAVNTVAPLIKRYWFMLPDNLNIFAIGKATQESLIQENFINIEVPPEFNSESLLSLSELQDIKNKNIVIFSGFSGRELLLKTLEQRGATVTKAICYRRSVPEVDTTLLQKILHQKNIDYIVTTSNEGLQNLLTMMKASQISLLTKPLVVISKRMYDNAQRLGFVNIILAKNASDEAIISAIG